MAAASLVLTKLPGEGSGSKAKDSFCHLLKCDTLLYIGYSPCPIRVLQYSNYYTLKQDLAYDCHSEEAVAQLYAVMELKHGIYEKAIQARPHDATTRSCPDHGAFSEPPKQQPDAAMYVYIYVCMTLQCMCIFICVCTYTCTYAALCLQLSRPRTISSIFQASQSFQHPFNKEDFLNHINNVHCFVTVYNSGVN